MESKLDRSEGNGVRLGTSVLPARGHEDAGSWKNRQESRYSRLSFPTQVIPLTVSVKFEDA